MEIYWLGEEKCHAAALVGGKAASLSRLLTRWPVPEGFTVCFEIEPGQPAEIEAGKVEKAYQQLCDRLGERDVSVAVRSSAVDEDGLKVSFAGQHESYLNLHGSQAILRGIQRCLDSMQSERALSYRQQHGLGLPRRAAVLVQQLVRSDVSAVVFSVDPCSGDPGHALVNATFGLGESLVSGTATPDLYLVNRQTLALETCLIAEKACMTVILQEGTTEIATPRILQREPALQPRQVADLAKMAIHLEAEQGWPVDLECAYSQDRLYLLQCRPITTVFQNTLRTNQNSVTFSHENRL
jgi:pyruvate,water dikinase